MKITTIILAHYKEREGNLRRIIDDLMSGTVKPDNIILFIDNPRITFNDDRAMIIRSDKTFLPIIRFALGSVYDTDYCFFIDDDLSVQVRTLENFLNYASNSPNTILGLEGSILGDTKTPYSNDKSINRGKHPEPISVDVIIRTYFVPTRLLCYGLTLRSMYPDFPKESLDDVFLCLGNKYLNKGKNIVLSIDNKANVSDIGEHGVGQSRRGLHYANRNKVCRALMNIYV